MPICVYPGPRAEAFRVRHSVRYPAAHRASKLTRGSGLSDCRVSHGIPLRTGRRDDIRGPRQRVQRRYRHGRGVTVREGRGWRVVLTRWREVADGRLALGELDVDVDDDRHQMSSSSLHPRKMVRRIFTTDGCRFTKAV